MRWIYKCPFCDTYFEIDIWKLSGTCQNCGFKRKSLK